MAERTKKTVRQIVLVALAFVAIKCVVEVYHEFNPTTSLLFADVGQGRCILVVAPNGKTLLVDAGTQIYGQEGREKETAQRILPLFARLGVRRLDVILVTHPDKDHYNLVPILTKEFPASLFWSPIGENSEIEWQSVKAAMTNSRTETVVVQLGQRLWLDARNGVSFEVLAPPAGIVPKVSEWSPNDASTVLKLRFGEFSVLFAGDVGEAGQRWLLNSGVDLRATILDVPHHGSKHNLETFLRAVRPKIAVISAGRQNPFGHPAPSTVEALERLGAIVWVTGEQGSLLIRTDGRNFNLTGL
ncbi:MAG: MBL fold metallo-hydrolase [Armatimonadetes bacterium]|nr:MBL fold metallo-hydrolase [Armatimonadota bacterium]MCX7967658.1 MBL fold metallo-hydrolase [Armatimonadota bacterium]MDW8143663.1 MBL fold metallo-hydrolase [Armatimonadota bacterium]